MWMIFFPVVAAVYCVVVAMVLMVKFFITLVYLSLQVGAWLCFRLARALEKEKS